MRLPGKDHQGIIAFQRADRRYKKVHFEAGNARSLAGELARCDFSPDRSQIKLPAVGKKHLADTRFIVLDVPVGPPAVVREEKDPGDICSRGFAEAERQRSEEEKKHNDKSLKSCSEELD